jgi:aldose 1-epimerase
MICAQAFTPVDVNLIPTGEIRPVEGTPLDFRRPKRIGAEINSDYEQINLAKGYDHNWVLCKETNGLRLAARVYEPITGRLMEVFTDQPGIQFYSGNFINGDIMGKTGQFYVNRGGLCLEAQCFPDTPNKANFPSCSLKPGHSYKAVTVYRFSTR